MKNKKILKAAVMLSLATTLAVPFNTLADSQGKRIGGRDRFEVAINVANKFSDSKSCIVLNYLAYSDSISSSEIAKGDMPIYYTKSDYIDSNTLKDIRNKGYKNVFIIGGEKSVSKNVENELAKTSKITRVSGRNRYDVNYKTLDKNKENLIVVSGENFADGLVSSALAQIKNATIAITPSNEVHERLKQYLNVNKNLKNIYIVGGEKSISKNVENKLSKYANVQRISGANRYETSEKLAKEISDSKYIVVSGENFADNLVAGSLARKDKRAVVLSKRADFSPMIKEISKDKDFIVVGGNLSIDESIFDKNLDTDKTENKKVTVKETIKYATKEEKDPTLKQGERKIKQRGANGEKEIIYEETYKDGVFISKKKIGENITKKPVDEIILVGTKVEDEIVVRTITEYEDIDFETERYEDDYLDKGKTVIVKKGEKGKREVVYEVEYKNGKELKKTKKYSRIVHKPVNQIINIGTNEDKKIIEPIPTTDEELIKYYNVDYNEPLSQKEQEIMDELNRVRKENGLNELKLSKTLTRTARIHARDNARIDRLTHEWSKEVLDLYDKFKFKKWQLGAETATHVNWGDDAKSIIQIFMDSPPHRNILMKENLVYVGVGRYDSKFDRNNDGRIERISRIFIEVYGEDEFNELDYIPD